MEKWSFNMLLFSRLTEVLDISGAEIARRCGLQQPVLNRYMNGEIVLSVQILMQICNGLRIPTCYFVSQDGNYAMPEREHATLPYCQWQPVTWNHQAVELTFGDGEGKIYWKDVAVVMNISSQKPHDWFLLRKRFPIDGFLAACSHYDISPFRFLIDPNRAEDSRRKGKGGRSTALLPYHTEEIASLNRKIDSLNAIVADLQKKYGELLSAHESLAKRVSVNVENMKNCFVNIDTHKHD